MKTDRSNADVTTQRGSVIDDTKKLLGRQPLLLRDWAKLHANELLEAAGMGALPAPPAALSATVAK